MAISFFQLLSRVRNENGSSEGFPQIIMMLEIHSMWKVEAA
jgi:hypothetical protein